MLQLFYEIAQKSNHDLGKWSVVQGISSGSKLATTKSSYTFLPDESRGGNVKKLYSVKSGKINSAQSSRTQVILHCN